jgi:hypothetical protein
MVLTPLLLGGLFIGWHWSFFTAAEAGRGLLEMAAVRAVWPL